MHSQIIKIGILLLLSTLILDCASISKAEKGFAHYKVRIKKITR